MDSDEIWRVSIDHGSTVSCQIWPGLLKGKATKAPTVCENLVEIATLLWFSAQHGQHNTPIQIKLSL